MAPRTCPTCKRPLPTARAVELGPFCSRRCKLADLGNWLDGRYVVADKSPFSEEELGQMPGAPNDGQDEDGHGYE